MIGAGIETTATLQQLLATRRRAPIDHFSKVRAGAAEALEKSGFPKPNDEEWRYTNVTPIVRELYRASERGVHAEVAHLSLCENCAGEIVFVNGYHSVELSNVRALPAGVTLTTLSAASPATLSRVAELLPYPQHPFVALNTAMLEDLLILEVAERTELRMPLHVIFTVQAEKERIVTHTRLIVIAGRDSRVSLTETYAGEGSYLTNAVTEIYAADGALVEHVKLVRESSQATHISNFAIEVQRSGSVQTRLFSFGGAVVRNELLALLDGEGAECILDGLYVNGGTQHTDNHTVIVHAKPHTTSLELYKGILDGRANGIFDGKIVVRKGAQKTSSRQTNNNLLLSREAVADSKPQLEIHADDVKCNHGSTIGQLSEDALFYLRSRGIPEAEARNLLTLGFAGEIIQKVRNEKLREHLERELRLRINPEAVTA